MEENNNNSNVEVAETINPSGKNQLKIIVSVSIVAVLILVLIGIAAVAGVFGSRKKLLINAVGNALAQSAEAVGKVWDFNEYREMFADEKFSVEADFSVGEGVQAAMNISRNEDISGATIDIGYYGSSLFTADLYADKKEILIGAPKLTDTVFYVDRENLDEDIEWFGRTYDLDSDVIDALKSYNEESQRDAKVYEELGEAAGKLTGAFVEMYDEMEVEKAESKNLKVDGEEQSCKGYTLTISDSQLQRLLDVFGEVYESNEVFRFYVDGMLGASYGYDSQEGFLEDYDPRGIFSGLGEKIEEEQEQILITFYLYRKNLARLSVELWDGVSVQWNVYGGNFPLENTDFTVTNGNKTSVYSRTGSREKDIYKAEYKVEYDDSEMTVSLEYYTAQGGFELEMNSDYGLYALTYLIEGEIDRKVPGSELSVSIDTFEMNDRELLAGDITFYNEVGEIIKPEGTKRNIMRMTQSDWYAVLWEIAGNLY